MEREIMPRIAKLKVKANDITVVKKMKVYSDDSAFKKKEN